LVSGGIVYTLALTYTDRRGGYARTPRPGGRSARAGGIAGPRS
jgi:hypothetical protein